MDFAKAAATFRTILDNYQGFWCVAGGWAIDFYLNRKTREHEDMEIVVLRNDSSCIHNHFSSHHPRKILSGDPPQFIPWDGSQIDSQVIQLRIDPIGNYDFDLLLTPSESGQWICRRNEQIRLPLKKIVYESQIGIPVLVPEIVLLFKAKYLRDKDTQDYLNTIQTLKPESLHWLRSSLKKIHPDHPWLNP